MTESLFASTTLPALEQVVAFTQKRHAVLASNVANLNTPGYRARDLSQEVFERSLKQALEQSRMPARKDSLHGGSLHGGSLHGGKLHPPVAAASVREAMQTIVYHDDSDVGIEHQIAEINKNQSKHNTAIAIMAGQFRLLQAAISERA